MSIKAVGAIAAGTFALGILTGTAGTIVVRDAAAPRSDLAALMADHMEGGGMGSMMSMMGTMPGGMGPDGGPMPMGPGASAMPGGADLHDAHHPRPSAPAGDPR